MKLREKYVRVVLLSILLVASSCRKETSTNGNSGSSSALDRNLVLAPGITNVQVLQQNWSSDEANTFYNTAQGSHLMPYAWFLHLEQPDTNAPFLDPQYIRSMGYLARSAEKSGNPDGLPVGFVQDGTFLGLTCSACHTAQINYNGAAYLIDGGPTSGDAEVLLHNIEAALKATLADQAKFDRFVKALQGQTSTGNSTSSLSNDLKDSIAKISGYNTRNFPHSANARFGPGRIDAFGAIMNEVAVRFAQVPTNETKVDAPVSYPFIWDTPQHDKVQWNGAAENTTNKLVFLLLHTTEVGALGRNIGEVMGVFGDVETGNDAGMLKGYASSVNRPNLIALETLLRKLWSPQWPTQFGAINNDLKAKGEVLYTAHCASCHAIIKRDDPTRAITADMKNVGTDETMAKNFATRRGSSGVFTDRLLGIPAFPFFRRLDSNEPIQSLLTHLGQRVVFGPEAIDTNSAIPFEYSVHATLKLNNSKLSASLSDLQFVDGKLAKATAKLNTLRQDGKLLSIHVQSDLDQISSAVLQKFSQMPIVATNAKVQLHFEDDPIAASDITYAYKARPLNGIWATAPYLHNGSVPNLNELLKPANQRTNHFKLGSREFDPIGVGFRTDLGEFDFDTTAIPGNSNAGHEYGTFTDAERQQLIEYLKSL